MVPSPLPNRIATYKGLVRYITIKATVGSQSLVPPLVSQLRTIGLLIATPIVGLAIVGPGLVVVVIGDATSGPEWQTTCQKVAE